MDAPTQSRWFHLTPGRFVIGLLAVEGLLWLSEWFGWLAWHKGYAVLTGLASVGVTMLLMIGWFIVALVFRRRFQFSIRSLLVLVIVVALPCSWMAAEMKKAREHKEAVEAIYALHGDVCNIFPYNLHHEPRVFLWLCGLLGVDFLMEVDCPELHGKLVGDDQLECLRSLPEIGYLDISGTVVTDAGLDHLRGLKHLMTLRLSGTKVTEDGIMKLQQALPNCEIVH
jgi:hypothetical protein